MPTPPSSKVLIYLSQASPISSQPPSRHISTSFPGLGGDRASKVGPQVEGDGGQHREVQEELREGRQGVGHRPEAVQVESRYFPSRFIS